MKIRSWVKNSAFILLISLMFMNIPFMTSATQKTIRVGCVDIDNFLKITDAENASGYGAEYLAEIKKYTNWKYEYVMGTWFECLEWLRNGEIDLLLPAEYSEERAKEFLFSNVECCLDYTALVGRKYDERYYEDYEAFDGMYIGLIKGNFLNLYFENYALKHQFSYHSVYYDTGTELTLALENKEVDAIVNGNMEYNNNQKLLAKINYMPAYFIMTPQNKPLMDELNAAVDQILLYNPYYTASLHTKYYSSVDKQSVSFTREESQFIKQSEPITIIFDKNNYPMEWYDEKTKSCRGVYIDILKLIEKESGLKFTILPNESKEPAWKNIESHTQNIWGSAYIPNADRTVKDLIYTNSYYDCTYSLVGKKEKNINMSNNLTIAILEQDSKIRYLIEKQYPNWTIVTYENRKNCLASVESHKVDLAAFSTLNLSVNEDFTYRSLVVIDGDAMKLQISLGLSKESNPMLVSILNKSILKINTRDLENEIFNSILSLKETVNFSSLVAKYPIYSIIVIAIIFVIICIIVFLLYRYWMNQKQNQILQAKNKELENALELQEELRIKAQTDVLTGISNKSNIEYTCQKYLQQFADKAHALLILDIDDFKHINDTYGHLFGDAVLKQFSHILVEEARSCDLVARIGGDEFLLFMTCIENKMQVIKQVENICKKIKMLEEVPISCSIGIIISEYPHRSYKELFADADKALYDAKNRGKNQYAFTE